MTTVYKVLGQSNPASATATTLYTVPAANNTVVSTITVCNQSSSNTSLYRIAIRPAGATLATQHYIAYDNPIGSSDSISLTLGITLSNTDVITVQANNTTTSFSAFGSEIY